MRRKSPDCEPPVDQMELFGFQAPPTPELTADSSQTAESSPDLAGRGRRVKEVLFNRHGAHVDGGDVQLTNNNGGGTLIQRRRGSTYVSANGEGGDVYLVERGPRPPDITVRQKAKIGLIPSGQKGETKSLEPTSIYDYPDLVLHYQLDELVDPTTRANVYKMVKTALEILRR